jgi:holo-[acyl-carrier protein] synthase
VIFGVGTDIVEISRMQETYDRFGKRFVERLLMPEERAMFESSKRPVRFLAMHFAGKEATVKAMGTGFRHGVWIRDVGIINNAWGRPLVIFSERAKGVCRDLGIGEAHVSLTDDAGLVAAFAVAMKA